MTALEILENKITRCTKCPDLVSSRTQAVFGEGNSDAKLLVIGEAPGQDEDLQGKPFVGQAGKLLDNIIKACGWRREDLFISNTCRCRPAKNRTPTYAEIENCREHLDLLIKTINPNFILCLGSTASQALVGLPITEARITDNLFYRNKEIFCTYHPSYILHQENEEKRKKIKADVWKDLTKLRELLKPCCHYQKI